MPDFTLYGFSCIIAHQILPAHLPALKQPKATRRLLLQSLSLRPSCMWIMYQYIASMFPRKIKWRVTVDSSNLEKSILLIIYLITLQCRATAIYQKMTPVDFAHYCYVNSHCTSCCKQKSSHSHICLRLIKGYNLDNIQPVLSYCLCTTPFLNSYTSTSLTLYLFIYFCFSYSAYN